jgi:AcrR family transcriptional regulator
MSTDEPASLFDEQRDLARHRILGAARGVIASRGLDTRIEDVADAAKVGRRTIFRYFPTRTALLAAALRDSFERYRAQMPLLGDGDDVDEWLTAALIQAHTLNARSGRVYLQLALETAMAPELGEVYEERRRSKQELVNEVTRSAYAAVGGIAEPPSWLFDAFSVHLSPFVTQALITDFDRTAEESGRASASILGAALRFAAGQSTRPAE